MKLIELSSADKESYNRFVVSQTSGSFLQSCEWGEWQVRLGRAVYRFKITDDSGEQVASVQLIKMPLPFGRYYLYAPYGPVVGSRKPEVGAQILRELQKKFADSIFIRVEPKDINLPTTHYPLPKHPTRQNATHRSHKTRGPAFGRNAPKNPLQH
jgi:lipid II:glycine glycyltransferase (peptidoglycan interpeptide bridge formation enzyme)